MRLYSGEPVHSAFNIGHRICTPDLIQFIQKVVDQRMACLEPVTTQILDHQVVPQINYKATIKTITSHGETFRISLLQGDKDQQRSRIFYNYCDQTVVQPHEERNVFSSDTLEQLKEEALKLSSVPSGQIDFFVYTQSRMEQRFVTHFLQTSFGDLATEEATTNFTIPKEESDVVLNHQVFRMPSYYFVAYWLEGEVFESPQLNVKANQTIKNLFQPKQTYRISQLETFQTNHEKEHLDYVSSRLHSPD